MADLTVRIIAATATVRYRATAPSGRFVEETATVDLFAPNVQADYADSFVALANTAYEQVRGPFERLAAVDEEAAPGLPFTPPPKPDSIVTPVDVPVVTP
jgi:hypothetical protein